MIRAAAALAASVGVAAIVPAVLLTDHRPRQFPAAATASGPIVPSPAGSIDSALRRSLFGAGSTPIASDEAGQNDRDGENGGSADVPAIVGIVGRLPDQAVVLVRRASGGTRTIAIGDTVDGWRLSSIAADAVMFVQGDRRERVEIASGAAPTPDQ